MLRHIITWRLAAEDPSVKYEQTAMLTTELNALVPQIPEILSLTVGSNAVDIEGNWDLVLVIDFLDEQALKRYGPHPAHQRFVGIVRPLVAERAAIDFLI